MFREIIENYKKYHRQNLEKELNDFLPSDEFKILLQRVAYCRGKDGKKYAHQYRITKLACDHSYQILKKLSYEGIQDFDSLHRYLTDNLISVRGVGKLYIYDATLRIGNHLGFEPDLIYLHAGTLEGAKNLELPTRKGYLKVVDLPQALRKLEPKVIEAVLCIYKDCFKNGKITFNKVSQHRPCGAGRPRGRRC